MPSVSDKPEYSGELKRNPETGEIEGFLIDSFKWKILIRAVKHPTKNEYQLIGRLDIPTEYLIPLLDDDRRDTPP